MALLHMHHVGVVVEDLPAAIAFFEELGMQLEGEMPVEGRWVDRICGIDGIQLDMAMLRTPDGKSRLELNQFRSPPLVDSRPKDAPANTLGLRSIMFAVDDIEDTLESLRSHGAELIGDVVQFEEAYLLCYVRGPGGIIVALAEPLES